MKSLSKLPNRPPTKQTPNAETKPVIMGNRAPRLPHEHDESGSSQSSDARKVMEQAYTDLQNGLKDTSMGPPMDDHYKRTFRTSKP